MESLVVPDSARTYIDLADKSFPHIQAVSFDKERTAGELEMERKININADPRPVLEAWNGASHGLQLSIPVSQSSERWVMFIPRNNPDKPFYKLLFIRDARSNAPPIIRMKGDPAAGVNNGHTLARRELYYSLDQLPQLITSLGADPALTYPISDIMVRERVSRLALETATGHALLITADSCHLLNAPSEAPVPALFQGEVEFAGIKLGVQPPTYEEALATIDRGYEAFFATLKARGLLPEPTDLSKGKWLQQLAKQKGVIA